MSSERTHTLDWIGKRKGSDLLMSMYKFGEVAAAVRLQPSSE